jgi:hypothetical protein
MPPMNDKSSSRQAVRSDLTQGNGRGTYVALGRLKRKNAGSPTGREPLGDGVPVVVSGRESRLHGEGGQVSWMVRS